MNLSDFAILGQWVGYLFLFLGFLVSLATAIGIIRIAVFAILAHRHHPTDRRAAMHELNRRIAGVYFG